MRARLPLLVAGLLAAAGAHAHQTTVNNTTTQASLDFIVNIGKFLYFRVGAGPFPAASGTIDTVAFDAVPTIPPGAVVAVPGGGTTVTWGGTLPPFTAAATVLPVEVRSNAGQVSIYATVTTALTSGANTIPMTAVVLTASNPALPAPVLPAAGIGSAVNVTGGLVTQLSGNWTFSYNNPAATRAGVYTGQVTFTASAP